MVLIIDMKCDVKVKIYFCELKTYNGIVSINWARSFQCQSYVASIYWWGMKIEKLANAKNIFIIQTSLTNIYSFS